ncbi:hypothetical protein [Vibrio parahaemolyticus]|uniref:hypothetical protein n=1 Tax=Vibrio parahaemolyticus TaxID=670 RepID=UPI0011AEF73C|nr:hypothetical protein [Vibrio parahaemolyticus]
MQREKDSHDLKVILESLFQFDGLKPTESLDAAMYGRREWYESKKEDRWSLKSGDILYEAESSWLDCVKLITMKKDSDIKLKVYPTTGKSYTVPVTRRNYKDNREEVTFVISRIITKIELVISEPESSQLDVEYLRIEGVHVGKLSEALSKGKLLLDKIDDDVKVIQSELDSEISKTKSKFEKLTEDKAKLEGQLSSLKIEEQQAKVKVNSLNDQAAQQESFVDDLNNRLEKNKNELTELQKKLRDTKEKKDAIEISKEELSTQLSDLRRQVLEVQSSLDEYKKNATLYSEDFSTLKLSVKLQNLFYGTVLIVTTFIGWWLICNMYEGALSLSLTIDEKELPLKAIWPLLVSRLPLIAINFFLLTGLSSLILYLIKIIVKNNEETKKIKQAAYLVREVVTYQKSGVAISDKEIFEQRVNAKLKLIQKLLQPEQSEQEQKPIDTKSQTNSEELIQALESALKKYSGGK